MKPTPAYEPVGSGPLGILASVPYGNYHPVWYVTGRYALRTLADLLSFRLFVYVSAYILITWFSSLIILFPYKCILPCTASYSLPSAPPTFPLALPTLRFFRTWIPRTLLSLFLSFSFLFFLTLSYSFLVTLSSLFSALFYSICLDVAGLIQAQVYLVPPSAKYAILTRI